MTLTVDDYVTKCDSQIEADIGSETLMMQVDTGTYFSVDSTAQTIWEALDGPTPVAKIIEILLTRYEVSRETCEAQTLSFLEDLIVQNLITRHEVSGTNSTTIEPQLAGPKE